MTDREVNVAEQYVKPFTARVEFTPGVSISSHFHINTQ